METSQSDAKDDVLHAQNHRCGLGPTETCNSGPKVSVFLAKTTNGGWDPCRLVILLLRKLRGLGPKETCKFGGKHAVFYAQSHR